MKRTGNHDGINTVIGIFIATCTVIGHWQAGPVGFILCVTDFNVAAGINKLVG